MFTLPHQIFESYVTGGIPTDKRIIQFFKDKLNP